MQRQPHQGRHRLTRRRCRGRPVLLPTAKPTLGKVPADLTGTAAVEPVPAATTDHCLAGPLGNATRLQVPLEAPCPAAREAPSRVSQRLEQVPSLTQQSATVGSSPPGPGAATTAGAACVGACAFCASWWTCLGGCATGCWTSGCKAAGCVGCSSAACQTDAAHSDCRDAIAWAVAVVWVLAT